MFSIQDAGNRFRCRSLRALCVCGSAVIALSAQARADVTLVDEGGVKMEVGAMIGAGTFHVNNANLGAGVVKPSGLVDKDRSWSEGFVAPHGKITISSGNGDFYVGTRLVGSGTVGDGDAAGLVQGNQGRFDVDHLYVGWNSASLFPSLGDGAIDVSFGRQPFAIGDGFIINDGNFDMGREGAFWLAPRNGWGPSTVVARVNVDPVHADFFRLKSDPDSNSDVIYGTNLEWRSGPEGANVVGGSYLHIGESKLASRDGMNVYSLRAQGAFIPGVQDLFLSAEYVKERNNQATNEVDAHAWYGEAAYTASSVPWAPTLTYRYSHFSGDKSSTTKSEAFDTLHYGVGRGWGVWFQGEVAGEYFGPIANTNTNVHAIQLSAKPVESLTLSAIYYILHFDETPVGITSSHIGNEINLIADWQARDNLTISGVVGRFDAASGGKQFFGGTKDETVMQIITMLSF